MVQLTDGLEGSPVTAIPAFLTDDWFAALTQELSATRNALTTVNIGQIVTNIPPKLGFTDSVDQDESISYTICIEAHKPIWIQRDSVKDATVTFKTDYTTAAAIASGNLEPAQALAQGRLRLRGDATALVAARGALEVIGSTAAAKKLATNKVKSEHISATLPDEA